MEVVRKFKILKWPEGHNIADPNKHYPLIVQFEISDIVCLDVDGNRMYFYPNEVKEVTNEGD